MIITSVFMITLMKRIMTQKKGKMNISTLCRIHLNPQSILLQAVFVKVLNTEEKHFANCRVIFDSGSQRTCCTQALKDKLNLKPIRSELFLKRRFATEKGVLKEIDVVQIYLKSKTKSTNVNIEALSIPFLCSYIQEQSIETLDISKYNYLKDLDFADKYILTIPKSPLMI